jgi:hypothetical protein
LADVPTEGSGGGSSGSGGGPCSVLVCGVPDPACTYTQLLLAHEAEQRRRQRQRSSSLDAALYGGGSAAATATRPNPLLRIRPGDALVAVNGARVGSAGEADARVCEQVTDAVLQRLGGGADDGEDGARGTSGAAKAGASAGSEVEVSLLFVHVAPA